MRDTYYVIHNWMIKELKLKGLELTVYGIVYGFNQVKGVGAFHGSLSYLEELTGYTKQNICLALKTLTEKKLILKREVIKNNIKTCSYTTNHDLLKFDEGINKILIPSNKKTTGINETLTGVLIKNERGVNETLTNNIDNNISDNKKENAPADADALFELPDAEKNNTNTKKIKSDKKVESDYKKVIDCFYTLFEKTCGYKPTWNNRLGGDVKRLLKIHAPEELCRRLKNYFTCDDNFIKKNISWSGFIANIDKPLIVKISSQGVDNTSDYEKAISDAEARGLTALANALREEQEDKKTGAR